MTHNDEKILCKTPTPGKAPTRIPKWKFDAVRAAILKLLGQEQEIFFAELPDKVGGVLGHEAKKELGSLTWHVTTVKLHMETEGEIRRVPGKGRQRITAA